MADENAECPECGANRDNLRWCESGTVKYCHCRSCGAEWQVPGELPTMTPPEIRYLGDMQKLKTEPGDLFVLSCDYKMSMDAKKQTIHEWREKMPGCKLFILEPGMKLGVVAGADISLSDIP